MLGYSSFQLICGQLRSPETEIKSYFLIILTNTSFNLKKRLGGGRVRIVGNNKNKCFKIIKTVPALKGVNNSPLVSFANNAKNYNFKWVTIAHIYLICDQNLQILMFNPLNPEFTIVIIIHYKPRIAAAILDL